MSDENLKPSVGQMLRVTGANTATFMEQVAEHVEKLEAEVARLAQRVTDLEAANDTK
jgi:outer membrane murein-binding lipoprotein Lpp